MLSFAKVLRRTRNLAQACPSVRAETYKPTSPADCSAAAPDSECRFTLDPGFQRLGTVGPGLVIILL